MYILFTLREVVVIALNTGILRSVSTTRDQSGVTAEHDSFSLIQAFRPNFMETSKTDKSISSKLTK